MSKAEQNSSTHSLDFLQGDYPWHTDSWHKFHHARKSNHLPHALLLSGAEHTGKSGFSGKVVKSLLCESPNEQSACNQCRNCKTYEAKANPDYLQIDLQEDKQQISVDQIRKMNQFLTLSRSFNAYRVVLISETERMNKNAANSLLKSLEEPAENSVIILVTSQLSSILPTIKSRCQLLHLATPSRPQAMDWLKQQMNDKAWDDEQIEQKLDIAQNKPLAALEVDEELIKSREFLLDDILNVIQEKSAITDIAKKWHKHDHTMLLDWQIGWLYRLLTSDYKKNTENQHIKKKSHTALSILKENILNKELWGLYDQLLKQKQLVHTSVNPLIFLENMLTLWFQAKHC